MWAVGFGVLFILTTLALYEQHKDKIAWENHQRNVEKWKRYYAERRERNARLQNK